MTYYTEVTFFLSIDSVTFKNDLEIMGFKLHDKTVEMRRKIWIGMVVMVTAMQGAEPIVPIPQSVPHDPRKAELGKKLFFDPILSRDRTVACVSCHHVSLSGADGQRVSTGIRNLQGTMNSPTVFNAVFNFSQFWNGRAKNLNEQALGPIHNPVEMGLPLKEAARRVTSDSGYRSRFMALSGRAVVTPSDIADAIAEYEKTLITPNGKFDRYLRGELSLSPDEAHGYLLFKTLGCVTCHNGVNVGGNSFQKMGAIISIPYDPRSDDRYAFTGRPIDKNVFKVPTLRNIAHTSPYFHDGSAVTLAEAIAKMSYHNLGLTLSPEEVRLLLAFLHTLSGELPESVKQIQ